MSDTENELKVRTEISVEKSETQEEEKYKKLSKYHKQLFSKQKQN